MASSVNKSGYECEFTSAVPDSLVCMICMNPARDPHQISCCGKVFCKFCLDKLPNRECPHCRSRNGNSFQDKRGERDLLSFQVKCTNAGHGCSWTGELRNMEEHAKKCSMELTSCPYSSLGCEAKLLKPQLEHHENTCTVEHLALAVKRINLLEEKLEAKEMKKMVPPIIFKTETIPLYTGGWHSPPFYTHSEGYKLYLDVYTTDELNISVYVCLMRGEFDDDLTWPFRGVISFEVLNQEKDGDHLEGSAKFLERKSSPKNKRVTANEGTRYVGWGEEDFVEFTDYLYVTNGTIYIKVSDVEVSELNKPWLINDNN